MHRSLICITLFFLFSSANAKNNNDHELNYEEVEWRLETLPLMIEVKSTPAVKSYLNTYLVKDRAKAEAILGRALLYFHTFEEELQKANLPSDLKYLAVVESALHPDAQSWVSARGLWQFMPGTGREYGLQVTGSIDERCDPRLSTRAAIEYLQRQYAHYQSWELALAAYNSGPGRVNRAIRLSGSTNFWVLQQYLPRETRNYVPAFIAAAYLINNYQYHGLEPDIPGLDYQLTTSVKIYDELSFTMIQRLTKLPLGIIQDLNPSYKQQFIPVKPEGNWLILPSRVMPAVVGFLKHQHPENADKLDLPHSYVSIDPGLEQDETHYFATTYTVEEGDNLRQLARIFEVPLWSLAAWNNRTHNSGVEPGEELTLYLPKSYRQFDPYDEELKADIAALESLPVSDHYKLRIVEPETNKKPEEMVAVNQQPLPTLLLTHHELDAVLDSPFKQSPNGQVQRFFFHRVRSGETLSHIASRYPGVTVRKLKAWNNISDPRRIRVGKKLRIYSRA